MLDEHGGMCQDDGPCRSRHHESLAQGYANQRNGTSAMIETPCIVALQQLIAALLLAGKRLPTQGNALVFCIIESRVPGPGLGHMGSCLMT